MFCDGESITFHLFFPLNPSSICSLKSPLTALIVTGFCCFSSKTLVQKKSTQRLEKKNNTKTCVNAPGWLCFGFVFPLQNKDGVC